jgi:hypothetical protein
VLFGDGGDDMLNVGAGADELRAVAFAAETAGASRLWRLDAMRKYRFLGDDGLQLARTHQGYLVQPAHPSLRLWRDSERRLLESDTRKSPAWITRRKS